MPIGHFSATTATGGRSTALNNYTNKGTLYGPWLGTSPVTLSNVARSVGISPLNPVSYFQAATGSRLLRNFVPNAAASPATGPTTPASVFAAFRRTVGF